MSEPQSPAPGTAPSRRRGGDPEHASDHVTDAEDVEPAMGDLAPGDEHLGDSEVAQGIRGYFVGLVLAFALTGVSFFIAQSTIVWVPSIPIALSVLAVAQMGVHLVFFLHMTSGPDNINNALALAFGILIVMLLVFGSLWIMFDLNHTMIPMEQLMKMQR